MNPSNRSQESGQSTKITEWTTYDLGCSVALLCAGFELVRLDKSTPRKVLMVFKREDGIESVVDSYWADRLEVRARAYFDTLKMMKNRILSE